MTELKIPEVGESVQEALLAQWLKREGESVRKDDVLFVIETDKVTLEISAPADGVLKILVPEGATVKIGTVVGRIEEAAGQKVEAEPKEAAPPPPPAEAAARPPKAEESADSGQASPKPVISPSIRALAEEKGVDLSAVTPTGPGGRITQGDVLLHLEGRPPEKTGTVPVPPAAPAAERPPAPAFVGAASSRDPLSRADETVRKPMSPIRQRIAARLLEARQNTAMLTTFNEIDMSRVQALRKTFGEEFHKKHGTRLGLMSFFVKATVAALKEMPLVNGFIDGNEIVYHNYYHIGMAIGAVRGLVVPVIRHADTLGFAAIEQAIADFAQKVRDNKLDISDLEGGTFTITNGGVFGSLLSTPILNPPQSAILGLHKIEERPIAVAGQVVIRPMMYVALSYDHRIIDGREAVTFLRRIKEFVENPERIMMEI
ncbi:MAG: 2-oxoglutarate dehydrogenase complex dihydrolipoyllysine-residue succinyltransferase [Syntrophobacteraceae bacterium]|nr:2-oxoglutarate dehydrogenase complex dihydrolipoyllysine-residue succinyltransferase [Syntrophobacteraceae bacterium]